MHGSFKMLAQCLGKVNPINVLREVIHNATDINKPRITFYYFYYYCRLHLHSSTESEFFVDTFGISFLFFFQSHSDTALLDILL